MPLLPIQSKPCMLLVNLSSTTKFCIGSGETVNTVPKLRRKATIIWSPTEMQWIWKIVSKCFYFKFLRLPLWIVLCCPLLIQYQIFNPSCRISLHPSREVTHHLQGSTMSGQGPRPRRLRAQNPTGMIHWDWDKVVNIPDFWPDFFRYQRHQPRLFWSWLKDVEGYLVTLLVIWTINEMSNKGWRLHTPRWWSKLWGARRQLFHIGKIVGKHGDSGTFRLSLSQVGMRTPFGENHSDGD